MIGTMDRRIHAAARRRLAGAGRLAAPVLGAAALLALLLPAPVAWASSPPVPPGTVHSQLETPNVYPGNGIAAFGDAASGVSANLTAPAADPSFEAPVTAMVATRDGGGMWLAAADGAVAATGDATSYGTVANLGLQGPIVGMAGTPTGQGYWLVALDGGIFAFGNATFYGSMGGHPLNEPIVGMAATPDRPGLLAGGRRRRDLRLRRRPGSTAPWAAGRWRRPSTAWRPRPQAPATGWWRATAASSPSAPPASTAPPAACA